GAVLVGPARGWWHHQQGRAAPFRLWDVNEMLGSRLARPGRPTPVVEESPMRRWVHLLVAGSVAVGLVGVLSIPVGAQTGDVAALCAARIEANGAETKAENQAVLDKLQAAAPAAVVQPLNDLEALFNKKG